MPISGTVLLGYGNKGVRIGGYGIHDLREGGVGVAAVVLADCDGGVEVFEEGEGGLVYDEVVAGFALGDGVGEEFCCGVGVEVTLEFSLFSGQWGKLYLPRVTTLVHIFGISANSNSLALGNTIVDRIRRSES